MQMLVDIPGIDLERLDEICHRQQLSREEALRRAIAEYVNRHRQPMVDEAFGIWHDRQEDGVAYQRRLRAEWTT